MTRTASPNLPIFCIGRDSYADEVKEAVRTLNPSITAHGLNGAKPLCGKSAIHRGIAHCGHTNPDLVGNCPAAKHIANVGCCDFGCVDLFHGSTMIQILWICNIQIDLSSIFLDFAYGVDMELTQKETLSRVGDMGIEACAIRLRAARLVTGLAQKVFAAEAGVGATALNNAEAGLTFPSRDVMVYLYRAHRIDFNFVLHGDFAQLPGDVQAKLFPALEAAASAWDQREHSNQNRGRPNTLPSRA
jgi:transcriptional regulator with XRE-family HTH domain